MGRRRTRKQGKKVRKGGETDLPLLLAAQIDSERAEQLSDAKGGIVGEYVGLLMDERDRLSEEELHSLRTTGSLTFGFDGLVDPVDEVDLRERRSSDQRGGRGGQERK